MRTTDLFKNNRSSKRLNESLAKMFGAKLDLETFDTPKLEDARNKLRTQIHSARTESGFNETIENEALTQAQWMHDAIVAELMDRQEHIVDVSVQEGPETDPDELFNQWMNSEDAPMDDDSGDENAVFTKAMRFLDGRVPEHDLEGYAEELADRFHGGTYDDEGGETDDSYALASAGFGSDEDYESIEQEGAEFGAYDYEKIAQQVFDDQPDLPTSGRGDEFFKAAFPYIVQLAGNKKRANYMLNYDEDFPSDLISAYSWLQKQGSDVGEDLTMERDRDPEDWDEGNTEPPNNFAIYINGKKWKIFPGRGTYADDYREKTQYQQLKAMCDKKSAATGKKWTVHATGENPTESVNNESINTGDNMHNLREGEIQQASAIVTAKTMVDRVGRWIEELSGMENDTLLQLGDSIRDEMGQEQAKAFISTCAPAIQAALENLKSARETLSGGVRALTGEEQPAEMLGGEPGADMAAPSEPDAMNPAGDDMTAAPAGDDFDAAEPAAGGLGDAGREQRESIDRQSRLLKVLAG